MYDETLFTKFSSRLNQNYEAMVSGNSQVFTTETPQIFEYYLSAFPEGTNPIFRTRTVHDCNTDKQFIRNIGRVVTVNADGSMNTIWQGLDDSFGFYKTVADVVDGLIRSSKIMGIFAPKDFRYGVRKSQSFDEITKQTVQFDHFWGDIPNKYRNVNGTKRSNSLARRDVLRRTYLEFTQDAISTVLDLIENNAIYRGREHESIVKGIDTLLKEARKITDSEKLESFFWNNSNNFAAVVRNSSIGQLISNISTGESVEVAVRKFEAMVAGPNYKRPTAIITPMMIDKAMDTIRSLDLESALERRYARIEDVSVNNVIFVDNDTRTHMKDGIEGILMGVSSTRSKPKKNNLQAEEIWIEDFLENILPQSSSVEVEIDSSNAGNFMSLTAPVHWDSEDLFAWDNNFAWSYDGDVADSIKQRVKAAGGKVDAPFRISLGWSNRDDLDLHVFTPVGSHIYYGNKRDYTSGGKLDVDMHVTDPRTIESNPVENIYWNNIMDGTYKVKVDRFTRREDSDEGYTVEIELRGRMVSLSKTNNQNGEITLVVEKGVIKSVKGVGFTETKGANFEKWGVSTNKPVRVRAIMTSPNHWNGQKGIGNKHWFFILDGCENPGEVRGIYNEFLKPELQTHRKVFEVIGSKTKCPHSPHQLSGVGFSDTMRDTFVEVIVHGTQFKNRKFKIKFA